MKYFFISLAALIFVIWFSIKGKSEKQDDEIKDNWDDVNRRRFK